jgi:ERF superfamily
MPDGTGTALAKRGKTQMAQLSEATQFFELVSRAASDPAVDVHKMQALLEMQRQLMADQARREFNEAFARLASRLPRISKNGAIEYPDRRGGKGTSIAYAKWEDIDAAIRPLYLAEGFTLSFDTEPAGEKVIVIAFLQHVGGHARRAQTPPLAFDGSGGKNATQAAGSTFSYGKRYAATMIFNIVTEGEDTDGVFSGLERIEPAKAQQLGRSIESYGGRLDRFLSYMGVQDLSEILVRDFPKAVRAIEDNKRKIEAARCDRDAALASAKPGTVRATAARVRGR